VEEGQQDAGQNSNSPPSQTLPSIELHLSCVARDPACRFKARLSRIRYEEGGKVHEDGTVSTDILYHKNEMT